MFVYVRVTRVGQPAVCVIVSNCSFSSMIRHLMETKQIKDYICRTKPTRCGSFSWCSLTSYFHKNTKAQLFPNKWFEFLPIRHGDMGFVHCGLFVHILCCSGSRTWMLNNSHITMSIKNHRRIKESHDCLDKNARQIKWVLMFVLLKYF